MDLIERVEAKCARSRDLGRTATHFLVDDIEALCRTIRLVEDDVVALIGRLEDAETELRVR